MSCLMPVIPVEQPWAERDVWAQENEAMLWAQFAQDRAVVRDGFTFGEDGMAFDDPANTALRNWSAITARLLKVGFLKRITGSVVRLFRDITTRPKTKPLHWMI